MKKKLLWLPLAFVVGTAMALPPSNNNDSIVIKMYATSSGDQKGKEVGTVTVTQYDGGLLFTPNLKGLPSSGAQGFHIHENASCADGGMAAGGHWDPQHTASHRGPYGDGHLGDLPILVVGPNGDATTPVLAPRIHNLNDIKGHSLMIHEGGDNYSDKPEPLGGGGPRMWCGVIK